MKGRVRAALLFSACSILQAQPATVARYCLGCHSSAKRVAEIDLEQPLRRQPRFWQKALEQLSLGEMPPKTMPQPSPAEKAALEAWIRAGLRQAALERAGDPGPVVLRRLDNAEYGYTVRDLTGVPSLDPAREFPADGAAGEGFTNTGNALSMSPALVSKYLEAAKEVARHAVLTPDGLWFSRHTTARDQTNETLDEIRAFYARFTESGGTDTHTQQGILLDKGRGGTLPLRQYLEASLAVRDGRPAPGVASPKYLAALVRLMRGTQPSLLLDPLRQRWRTARAADVPALAEAITRWQQTLWKYSTVGHIGKADGPKAWLEPVTPLVERQEFRVPLKRSGGEDGIAVALAVHDAGDGGANDAITWKDPRLMLPGRPAIPLRDVRALVDALAERREAALRSFEDPAWTRYLGRDTAERPAVKPLATRITKFGDFPFIRGWGGGKEPTVLANASEQAVRVPGQMKPYGVAVLPTATQQAAIGWRSPITGPVRVELSVTAAHAECGNGTLWKLELRRGSRTRVRLAEGLRRGTATLERVPVQAGDLLSILVDARDGNASCDLTDLDWRVRGRGQEWSLAKDVAPDGAAANPQGAWEFYGEPGAPAQPAIPAGSRLARWFLEEDQRPELARSVLALLNQPSAPPAETPDGALYRLLRPLSGPLLADTPPAAVATGTQGLDPARFARDGSLRTTGPGVVEWRLPADLADGAEFAVTAEPGPQASVQLEVLVNAKPVVARGLLAGTAAVGSKDGVWTGNNQTVALSLPVVTPAGGAAWNRFAAQFDEFRAFFPASLCYTKIVPVDEVVTMTLFHREDGHLTRLMLEPAERRRLDALWSRLDFVSRAPLLAVDAFEQLYQFATQDADPSKFEPLRQPILDRAAAFRQQMKDAEPKHLEAVVAFAAKAYRRPLAVKEDAGLRALYARLRSSQDLPHEEAIRLTLVRVLTGPAFLYRTEKAAPAGVRQAPVSGWELASRLSYFLWSGPPDEALRKAAGDGQLSTAAGVAAQARRMLRDPRAQRLARQFGAAWLHLSGFESLDEKSERHFPAFKDLRGAMAEENLRFLADLFQSDRSLLDLLDSDHSFVNGALAKHYGLAGIEGPEWRRVTGMKAIGRGGLLGQAAVLAKQSGASRTSPILRGNWVSEVLLGDKLPRPPKDVPPLPEEESGASLGMRELTEKHTRDPRCASCHRRIDPFGFALERFDAIGRLRPQVVDTKTRVLDGTQIDGLEGLRQYLAGPRRAAFVRQFCRKLLGYALGRAVELSDEPLLDQMQARLAASGYRTGVAVEMVVTSPQFRQIRGQTAEANPE